MSQYDENLSENPFFREILTNNNDIIKRATEEGWIICVPRIGNLEASQITTDLILDHILLSDTESFGSYRTLSKKTVSIVDKQLIVECNPSQAFSNANVQILFEETHYTDQKAKYIVWCLDKPLFCDDICYSSHSSQTLTTLNDCIDFLWCESLGHSIFEQIQHVVAGFIEKSNEFDFETLQTQKEIIGSVYSQCLQVALKNDHLNKKSSDNNYFNNLKLAVETYMQSYLSSKLLMAIATNVCEYDAHLNKIIQNSSEIQLKDLNISNNFCDVITKAKCELNNLNRFKTIMDKTNCLSCTFKIIVSSDNTPREKEYISSDVLLQIFIFIILKLRINNWVTNLNYIKNFQFSCSNTSNEQSFLITTLEAAIEYIRSNDFFNMRSSLIYNEPNNKELVGDAIISKAFEYVRLGELENLIHMLEENKTYKQPEQILCHPLCCCENCIKYIDSNKQDTSLTVASRNDKEQTLLHVASLYGHCDIVEYLINSGADVNSKDFLGRTSLHYAAVSGLQGVLFLFTSNAKADVNIRDNNGNTPLILAANNGHDNCIKALLYSSVSVDLDLCNNYGDTALHVASKWGYVSIVQILLESNALTSVKNKRNQTPMDLAQNSYVTKLLGQFCQNQNVTQSYSNSPVNISKSSTDSDFSNTDKVYSEHGIKPKSVEQLKKVDLLLKAIQNNDLPLTCFYLGFSSTSSPSSFEIEKKCHPLCNCDKCYVIEKNYEIISFPKSSEQINVNFCNHEGYTPLHIAATYGRTDILRLLLDSGAVINLKTYKKLQTALHLCCINQRLQCAKVLLGSVGCDINSRDTSGNTPLYYACINNDVKMAELLLSNGANHRYRNREGKTVLEEVHSRMLYRVFKLLKKHSDVNDKFSDESLFI